ncbi:MULTISPECIES: type II toxin-antitoxin system PemK/MazF family toxin [Pseudomonas]|uniref:type II toxin-antitoxin system PemK/MazF family toxin n=1 Tax=Pseudomonas TaxID=286 RepID=UPI0023AA3F0C|nr:MULTISPECIES: type II toxin-antitoxin system PemK/MazF family toxin [Pseudomonas]
MSNEAAFGRLCFVWGKGLSLNNYHPKQGDVLLCDFTRGFVAPEMLKVRKVIVISPNATNRRRLCTVVPISSTAPEHEENWHHLLRKNPLESDGYIQLWVKCDMIYTVSFERLDKLHKKTRKGREYFVPRLTDDDLRCVLDCVRAYLPL